MRLPRLPRNDDGLLRPVLTLLSGSSLAQLLAYAARPLLTRLFPPEAYGLYGFFLAAISVLSAIAALRYDEAIVLPEHDEDANNVTALALFFTLVVALLAALALPWRAEIAVLLQEPGAASALLFVPVGLFTFGAVRIGEQWHTRHERFGRLSNSRIARAGTAVPTQVGAGFGEGGGNGLIGGTIAGWVASGAWLWCSIWHPVRGHVNVSTMRRMARRYRNYPRYAMPSSLLNSMSSQLPAFLLLYYFDSEAAGFYALSHGVMAAPMSLIGNSVGLVYFPRAVEARRTGTLGRLTHRIMRQLVLLSLVPSLAVIVAGPALFALVFGAEWTEAGVYARWLAPWMLFVFIASPLSRLFDVLERQRAELKFNVVLLAMRFASLAIGGVTGNVLLAIALYGLSGLLMWGALALWMLLWSGVSLGSTARIFGRYLGIGLVPLGLIVAVAVVSSSSLVITAVTIGALLLYFALAVWADGVVHSFWNASD